MLPLEIALSVSRRQLRPKWPFLSESKSSNKRWAITRLLDFDGFRWRGRVGRLDFNWLFVGLKAKREKAKGHLFGVLIRLSASVDSDPDVLVRSFWKSHENLKATPLSPEKEKRKGGLCGPTWSPALRVGCKESRNGHCVKQCHYLAHQNQHSLKRWCFGMSNGCTGSMGCLELQDFVFKTLSHPGASTWKLEATWQWLTQCHFPKVSHFCALSFKLHAILAKTHCKLLSKSLWTTIEQN